MFRPLGVVQIKKIERMLTEKVTLAERYNKNFSNISEVNIPHVPEYVTRHSWYLYSLKVSSNFRDDLCKHLMSSNIETRISFPPIHTQPYFVKRFGFRKDDFPMATQSYDSFIDIPIWVGMGKETQAYIIEKKITFSYKRARVVRFLLILGTGGHLRPVLSCVFATKKWKVIGCLDLAYKGLSESIMVFLYWGLSIKYQNLKIRVQVCS